jgi:hypothetical protein
MPLNLILSASLRLIALRISTSASSTHDLTWDKGISVSLDGSRNRPFPEPPWKIVSIGYRKMITLTNSDTYFGYTLYQLMLEEVQGGLAMK